MAIRVGDRVKQVDAGCLVGADRGGDVFRFRVFVGRGDADVVVRRVQSGEDLDTPDRGEARVIDHRV